MKFILVRHKVIREEYQLRIELAILNNAICKNKVQTTALE